MYVGIINIERDLYLIIEQSEFDIIEIQSEREKYRQTERELEIKECCCCFHIANRYMVYVNDSGRDIERERAIDIEKRSKKTFSLCFVHFATKQICYYYFTFLLAKRM